MQRNQYLKLITIGALSARSGVSVSKIRYYDKHGLLSSVRSKGGNRLFLRADNRRLAFIQIAQNFGYKLAEIRALLAPLPSERAPNDEEWREIANLFKTRIKAEIARLSQMHEKLDGCIGCGCLSVKNCPLYNADDEAAKDGTGAVFLQSAARGQE